MIYNIIALLLSVLAIFVFLIDPTNNFYRLLYYTLIPVAAGLIYYKYVKGKKVKLSGKRKIINRFLISTYSVLGIFFIILSYTDFRKEYKTMYSVLFSILICFTIIIILWSFKIKRK